MRPTVSVIIPVHNSAEFLRRSLTRLGESNEAPCEVIVVDDGSSDDSAAVARGFGAATLSTGGRGGPAAARNRGARAARGDLLFFIDADVLVQPDTIAKVRDAFADDPALDALMGSYDDSPGSKDFLSQYRNLMHHFVHQRSRREAVTFWSGCGAIRREVFLANDGFDESYGRPAIEDIELGYRLRRAGRKMILDREVQVTHLKKWTFWNLVKCDVMDRGIPWTELILRDRNMPNDLNLQLSQRVSVALAFLLCLMALGAAIWWRGYFLTPLFAALFLILGRYWGEAVSNRESRAGVVWSSLVAVAIGALAALHGMYGLIPPLAIGYALLFSRHRREYRDERRRKYARAMLALVAAAAVATVVFYLPANAFMAALLLVLLALIVLNTQFYLFLAAKRNRLFAVAAIPFHLLYHLYAGISFIAGATRYFWRSRIARESLQNRTSASSREP